MKWVCPELKKVDDEFPVALFLGTESMLGNSFWIKIPTPIFPKSFMGTCIFICTGNNFIHSWKKNEHITMKMTSSQIQFQLLTASKYLYLNKV